MTKPIVGISWYRREDYDRIREIMADGEGFAATYEEWQKITEAGESFVRAHGGSPVRAVIKPDEFAAWCRVQGLNVDKAARERFCVEAARKSDIGAH